MLENMFGNTNIPEIYVYLSINIYIYIYILWPPCGKETLAGMWLDDMPEVAVTIVRNKRLASGATLVKLESDITRPTARESQLGFGIVVLKFVGV